MSDAPPQRRRSSRTVTKSQSDDFIWDTSHGSGLLSSSIQIIIVIIIIYVYVYIYIVLIMI